MPRARARCAVAVIAFASVATAGSAASPEVLQARYDAARDREESLLAHGSRNTSALVRLRREIRAVERLDFRPSDWRRTRELPRVVLPRTASRARAERGADQLVTRRLAAIGTRYPGWAAFWIHDLTTGRTAGWNSDARFPAASLVKLGVFAAALARTPASPRRSPLWYDVRQLTGWSSNLASNRLVAKLGYPAVHDGLRRLEMWSSTYPGPYRAGTSLRDAPKPPPPTSSRVTTAHDLGRALWILQAAAAGNRSVQRRSRLAAPVARLALGLLVDSSSRGDNAGLLRPFVGRTAVAQKNGWTSSVRGTAAIVYRARGPVIVVVLVYRRGLTLREAQVLGRRTLAAAG